MYIMYTLCITCILYISKRSLPREHGVNPQESKCLVLRKSKIFQLLEVHMDSLKGPTSRERERE